MIMNSIASLMFSGVVFVCVSAHSLSQPLAERKLDSLYEAYHEFILREFPESASLNGDHRYDDRLTDYSLEARKTRLQSIQQFMKVASSVEERELGEAARLNRDLFLWDLDRWIRSEEWQEYLMPLSQQSGVHLDFNVMAEQLRMTEVKDKENYLRRLSVLPHQIDQIIELMKLGVKRNILPAKSVMSRVQKQLQALCEKPLEQQSFYTVGRSGATKPMQEGQAESPNLIAVNDKGLVPPEPPHTDSDSLLKKSSEEVLAAFGRLRSYVENVYLKACRTDDGMWSMPNGSARYERALREHTSLELDAQYVFDLGEREVARIEKQMKAVSKKLKVKETMSDFGEKLRSDPQYYFDNKNEMLEQYRTILAQATAGLPSLFTTLPKTPCIVKELEEYRADAAPQAYYYSAAEDHSRPGTFYVNCSHLNMRPKYTMTALTLHEAVPGHHLQIALAQENTSVPWFRRELSVTSFVEGWALYAESLGDNLGLYEDPLQKYGALGFELWRATRLVVDAGIHARKWTREQAINYMRKHTINSEHDIVSEVERYIAWPGQACAYKIGQLKILEMRTNAQKELGTVFSLPSFHSMLLENGSLPLPLLEKRVKAWIDSQRKN